MELQIQPYKLPDKITIENYSDLKAALNEQLAAYAATVYTDDQIRMAKADRAKLNKLRKALNDERIRREREYMAPFAELKAQVAELTTAIDTVSASIDRQIKDFEARRRAAKVQPDEPREWVTFRAYLTTSEAAELASWLDAHGIKFEEA